MKEKRTRSRINLIPEVTRALDEDQPVVALESALITHGFPSPANLEVAQQMEITVRQEGAVPATIAVLDGQPRVGLTDQELTRLAHNRAARKVSLRDLPLVLAKAANGGATVAATMHLAHTCGIGVFATGGIGGVHRVHPYDVSADLTALAFIPIVVVCAGAKAILDLPRTLQYLETHGVTVIGYGTDEFPAFYSRESALDVDVRVETPEEVVDMAQARAALGLTSALLVCAPVPEEDQLPADEAEVAIAQALEEAEASGIRGKNVTPFLLSRMVELTGGKARRANEALLINNARIAARIARALAAV